MQDNTESQEKKETKKVIFEAPGMPQSEITKEQETKYEEKMIETEVSREIKTEPSPEEGKEPKESDFKAPGELETGYTEKSWAKPQEEMKEKEEITAFTQERQEPLKSDFKAPGELETGYTEKSWTKPEKDMGEKEARSEFTSEAKEGTGEKTKEETREEKSTVYAMHKRLTKSKTERKIFGVCGGLGEYFGIDPTLIRLAFIVLALFNGIGLVLYIILAVIMPSEEKVEMVSVTKSSSLRK